MTTESTKVHHRLSPSAAHRWFFCPGEPDARESAPETSSIYADEGTTAHWVGEQCLRATKKAQADPAYYVGQVCPETKLKVPEDCVEPVREYLREVVPLIEQADAYGVECRFDLNHLHKGLAGTCDFWAYNADTRTLYTRDYKHGQGKVVEVDDNPQLLIYACGAAYELRNRIKGENLTLAAVITALIDHVDFGIVQPRAGGEPVRTVRITGQALALWAAEKLAPAAVAASKPGAPRVAGDHCGFCPAKVGCPAIAARASELAKADFANAAPVLPDPAELTIERLAVIASAASLFSDWAKAAESELFRRLQSGQTHPDWKIVQGKRGNRKWKPGAEAAVVKLLGDEAYDHTLKSPKAVEDLLKDELGLKLPDGLVYQEDGKPTLAPASDKRPALVNNPSADFDGL